MFPLMICVFLLLYSGGQQIRKCVSDSSFTTFSQLSTPFLDCGKCTRDYVRPHFSRISIALRGSRPVSPWLPNSHCASLSLQPISCCHAFPLGICMVGACHLPPIYMWAQLAFLTSRSALLGPHS